MRATKSPKQPPPSTDEDSLPRLCSRCVGDAFLRTDVEVRGVLATCSFCDERGRTFSVEEVADRVERALEQHYVRTPSEPSGFEYALMKDSEDGYEWEREGEPILEVVTAMVEVDEQPAQAILAALQDREGYTDGEEGSFDDGAHYIDADTSDGELHSEWQKFEKSLKTEARFFSPMAQDVLGRVFKDIGSEKTEQGAPVVVEAGPRTTISGLFRARTFQSDSKLKEALCRPDLRVGSPPPELATAGRMNAYGISMFYAATDPKVAVAEVRPPVGSRVVVGRFDVLRSIRLLDVEALRSVLVGGSVFDPLFIGRLQRAKFLKHLSHRITIPVMPDGETLDYLVTQVIADFLASIGLDGIVFPSVQVPGGRNVVLFHKSARVEELSIPQGTELEASLYQSTEDGPETDYTVGETLPPNGREEAKPTPHDPEPLVMALMRRIDEDPREPTLRLDTATLEVRHIKAVSFETEDYVVRRHRFRFDDDD